MRSLVPVALLLVGCLDADLGDFDGFEEVGAAWGLAVERARGVCLFDADGDEDLDVLFTLGDGLSLHLNFAPGVFVDATESAGFDGDVGESPAGCGAADLDGDGDRDVVITFNRDDTRVFRNDGRANFEDATAEFGVEGWGQSSVVFDDIDRDGRVDVLIGGAREGRTQLLRNTGTLQNVTPEALVAVEHSWGGAVFDADNDGLPEIFLGTDGNAEETGDLLLDNRGGFRFAARDGELANTLSAMGTAVADVDADGALDLYVTNIGHHPLWHNTGDGTFIDRSVALGVWSDHGETAGWGSGFLDVDDDGRLDLFKANGGFSLPLGSMDNHERKADERNALFMPQGEGDPVAPGLHRRVDAAADLGLDDDGSALGAAWGDLDGDGRLDLVVANFMGAPTRTYRNRGRSVDPGRLRLALTPTGDDPDGFGTRVRLEACGTVQQGLVSTGPSVFSQSEAIVHFGLDGCTEDVSVTVTWPDGTPEEFTFDVSQWSPFVRPLRLRQGLL